MSEAVTAPSRGDRHVDHDRQPLLILAERRQIGRQLLRQHRKDLGRRVDRGRVGAARGSSMAESFCDQRVDVGDGDQDPHRAVRQPARRPRADPGRANRRCRSKTTAVRAGRGSARRHRAPACQPRAVAPRLRAQSPGQDRCRASHGARCSSVPRRSSSLVASHDDSREPCRPRRTTQQGVTKHRAPLVRNEGSCLVLFSRCCSKSSVTQRLAAAQAAGSAAPPARWAAIAEASAQPVPRRLAAARGAAKRWLRPSRRARISTACASLA